MGSRGGGRAAVVTGLVLLLLKHISLGELSLAHIVYAVIHYVVSDIAGGKFESCLS